METTRRAALEPELDPGEQLLWIGQPSVRRYLQRTLAVPLLCIVVAGAVGVTWAGTIGSLLADADGRVGWILVVVVTLPLLTLLADIRLRRRTVYAITDRRLIRAGGKSLRSNRPGQTFTYRPEEVGMVEIFSLGLSQHVYIDRKQWGDSASRTVLVGFEDLADAAAVRDRIRSWLDDHEQGISGSLQRSAVE